jgi:multimeric flavodoxin WrbA
MQETYAVLKIAALVFGAPIYMRQMGAQAKAFTELKGIGARLASN